MLIKDRLQRIIWGAVLLIAVAVLDSLYALGTYRIYLYFIPYLVSGHFVLQRAFQNVFKGQVFDEFSLMSIATIGAFVIGEYPEGVFVMIFYELGEFAQHKAVNRVKSQIRSLVDKRPEKATLIIGDDKKEVKAEEVETGSVLLIKKGDRVPIDGELISDEAVFNTSDITGESIPRNMEQGASVASGYINSGPPIKIKTTKRYKDSTFSRIIQLTQEAAKHKAPTEHFFRKFARIYTPVVAILAIAIFLMPALFMETYIWQTWLYRACVFLVISCPCALVLSIPLTYFAGIGAAGNAGILVKGSNYIDQLTQLSGIVFDKTGTLTKGELKVNKITPIHNTDEFLPLLKELTDHSTHPASKAISDYLNSESGNALSNINEHTGKGVSAQYKGASLKLGAPNWINPEYDPNSISSTTILASYDDQLICAFHLEDKLKDDTTDVIHYLNSKQLNTYLLSGDLPQIVAQYDSKLGFTKAIGGVTPEEKLSYYKTWKQQEPKSLAFVGDGINDSVALVAADVGIAIGNTGSDVAIESADIVIPGDQLSHIPQALDIAKRTKFILWQNIIMVFLIKLLVLALGGVGIISLWAAIIADVGIAIVAVLNAGRLSFYKSKWSDD